VHREVEELRPKLKEILYDCAVDIRATKAALYLYDGAGKFELATEYGFRGGIRQIADYNDPLVDRAGRGRNAFVINGVATEPRFAELLFESGSDRMLGVPLYLRGQLVGVIDMRDKPNKVPFDQNDVPKALKIAERLVALFENKNIFGQRFISLSEADADEQPVAAVAQAAPAPRPAPAPAPQPPRPVPVAAPPLAQARPAAAPPAPAPRPAPPPQRTGSLATLILEARTQVDRMSATTAETLTEAEVQSASDVLRSILLIPGAIVAVFSAFGHLGGVQEIVARTNVADDAKSLLASKLNVWLSKRGESAGYVRTNLQTPFGTTASAITAADLQKVFTAPLTAGTLRGIYLTVAFAGVPDRTAHELLAALHGHLQLVLEQSLQRGATCVSRVRAAEKLLEPDFSKYPHLRHHADSVSRLAEAFARFLALPQADVDDARVLGLVHDAGMRLLDYERLYRKRDISQEELGILREHPVVGAALVEPFLGTAIARAVLSHHERVDGRGYPNELRGEDIPYLSRLLQVCDAYIAITDPDTYQPPETHDDALSAVLRGAGSQFDEELARRFVEFMRTQPR
jgi:HD domain/GAF domain